MLGSEIMKKNIAVVGGGYWGKNLVRNFYELKSLYAICDIDDDKLKSFKEKYLNVKTYNDYQVLLKDPNAKAIVISTPAATHYKLVREALLVNKDVPDYALVHGVPAKNTGLDVLLWS